MFESEEQKHAFAAFVGPILGESAAMDSMVATPTVINGQYSNKSSDSIRQEIERIDRESRHQQLVKQQTAQQEMINQQIADQQARINQLQNQAITNDMIIAGNMPANISIPVIPANINIPIIDENQLEINFNPSKQDETNNLLKEMNNKLTKLISLIESKSNVEPPSTKTSIPKISK